MSRLRTSFSRAMLEDGRRRNCWGKEFHKEYQLKTNVCCDSCSCYISCDDENTVSKGEGNLSFELWGRNAAAAFDETIEEYQVSSCTPRLQRFKIHHCKSIFVTWV